MTYLSTIPSEDVRARGFTVVVDMRGSKWDSVKPVLRTLQESFSSNIHTALLIKPDTFWQKHKTNLGSAKLSFEVTPPLFCKETITVIANQVLLLQRKRIFRTRLGLTAAYFPNF